MYVGDITQLGYDPTTSFIITYIAKLVHARYNLAGENPKLDIKYKCIFKMESKWAKSIEYCHYNSLNTQIDI